MTFVFNPIRELARSTSEFEREFDKLFRFNNGDTEVYVPASEITETKDSFRLELDLPGVKKEDVKISVDKNVLTIQGERKAETVKDSDGYHYTERVSGSFRRSFNLSTLVKSDAIEAHYDNGVLTLNLPKVEEAKPRQIEVKIA